ncbi:MAG: dTDP-4-dehydrorhamnose reductase [Marinosulfonomonas sp.]|nr:dTDP-4-dehydrorhamnose reductase [Marinosulfonomonas sp.]
MSVLVFGQTGQVAIELQNHGDVMALARDQADLSDPAACAAAILEQRPRVVINAAAYTAVDRAEQEENIAQIVNGEAPGAMARAAAELGIPFLHISTDYVFDGTGENPWSPGKQVNPIGAYGRTKLAGEIAVQEAGGNAAILRTSWVFSAHGANFVKTMLRLGHEREALNVVADQIGGPTPAADIARALFVMAKAMQGGAKGGLYHFAGQPDISWAGFAREVFSQAGTGVLVHGIPTTDYPTPAVRPMNSRLDCSSLMADFGIERPDWRAGLTDVLAELR